MGSFAKALRSGETNFGCHLHEACAGPRTSAASNAGRPFAFEDTARNYERDRPFRIDHMALDVTLAFEKKEIRATSTITATRVAADRRWFALDAVDFTVKRVELDGKPVRFDYDDRTLRIDVPKKKQSFRLTIDYVARPQRGLFFIEADPRVKTRVPHVWSQGQDEDSRAWFPCHDKPHIKHPTELTVRVPRGWFALSNGRLVDAQKTGNTWKYAFKQPEPHASYLVTLVAGPFTEVTDERWKRFPLTYCVPQGLERDVKRTFGRTPDMLKLFEEKTGVPFPFAKYAQIVVQEYPMGGMENTSATTMTDLILLDERAAIDVDMDGLIAHELAHQWFGDLVTCRDFSEGWLNEGWATYMELVWKESGTENEAGRDNYDYAVRGEWDLYADESARRYARPIVERDFERPMEIFDRHLYQKGALVLHALRCRIGDEAFWRGTRSYLERHAHGIVETRDFMRALEDASGQSLGSLFDFYVERAGHPVFTTELEITPRAKDFEVKITLKQRGPVTYLGPIEVELGFAGGPDRVEGTVTRDVETLRFTVPTRPDYVAVDPRGGVLAAWENATPPAMLRKQLKTGSTARLRFLAAIELGKDTDPKTVDALAAALAQKSEFYGVRCEAAHALGAIRSQAAFDALAKNVGANHAKVRRSVARGLGKFRTEAAEKALRPLTKDRSYLVQAEAARSLGATKIPAAFATLAKLLDEPSWGFAVRAGAADGLGALGDKRGIELLLARANETQDTPPRRACIAALARFEPEKRLREAIEEKLLDANPVVRSAAVLALDALGDVAARPALGSLLTRETWAIVRRRAKEALRSLEGRPEAEMSRLRDEVERAHDLGRELTSRLSALEAKLNPPAGVRRSEGPRPAEPRKPTKTSKRAR